MKPRHPALLLPGLAAACAGLLLGACSDPAPTPFIPGPVPAPQKGQTVENAPVKPGAITDIDLVTLFPLQQAGAVLMFDTRPAIFYHMGHIPGARSWPRKRFESQLDAFRPELAAATRNRKPVVLYCTDRQCEDARAMAERITALGHTVSILEGGYDEWKAAGLPTQ